MTIAATQSAPAAPPTSATPNVIFFLTDDLDWKLMPYLHNVQKLLVDQGATFDRFYVEESTCCTSRSSILTGEYAHNHHVLSNFAPAGGYRKFHRADEATALPTWLAANPAVVTRGLMGKYLNEYPFPYLYHPKAGQPSRHELSRYVPRGWNDWLVPADGQAYEQRHYKLNDDGRVGPRSDRFLDTVIGDRLLSTINENGGSDFSSGGHFLEWATYSPHLPYAHPGRFNRRYRNVHYPRDPSYDETNTSDKFGFAGVAKPLSPGQQHNDTLGFRNRIRSVQVFDHYVGRIIRALRRTGALANTYLVFSSDNGYHMGEHRLSIGKYTQFETDVRVPLVIRGPGIAAGKTISDLAGNIDLAETFADMTHTSIPPGVSTDGLSLLPRLTGAESRIRRNWLLLSRAETIGETSERSGVYEPPERAAPASTQDRLGNFTGVVGHRWKFIRYTHRPHHEELYDLQRDPFELNNLLARGPAAFADGNPTRVHLLGHLHTVLKQLTTCRGTACSSR